MKKNILFAVVSFALSVAPLAAQAQPVVSRTHVAVGVAAPQPLTIVPVRTNDRPAPPPARPEGRYEWRTTNQWVPGHQEWTRDDDAERCRVNPAGHVKCKKAKWSRVEAIWVPGHYESVGQWVFVAYPVAPPPPVYRPAPVNARLSVPVGPGRVTVGVQLPVSVDLS